MHNKIKTAGLWSVIFLVVYTTWIAGGSHVQWQKPFIPLALIIFVCTFFEGPDTGKNFKNLCKDPLMLIGTAFLGLLTIQCLNSGRNLLFNWETSQWRHSPPPVTFLPSAIHRHDALEMIRWFLPAWSASLFVRHRLQTRRKLHRLLFALVISAGILAFCSIAQYIIARVWNLCPPPSKSYFITSFGYANNAGAYFNLMLALSSGLLVSEIFFHENKKKTRLVILTLSTISLFIGANITHGRAAMLISWLIALITGVYIISGPGHRFTRAQKFNRIVATLFTGTMLLLLLLGFEGAAIRKDFFGSSEKGRVDINTSGKLLKSANFGQRSLQREISAKLIRDNFWFGAGAWAHRYTGYLYVDPEQQNLLLDDGDANMHNDTLQFAGEFGIAGLLMISSYILILLIPIIKLRSVLFFHPLFFFSLLGLTFIYLYSYFDLPFRSPAILTTWLLILTTISTWSKKSPRPV